jgi:hypothetical protein
LYQATDACSAALNVVQLPPAGTGLPLGATSVVFRMDDGNGNTNTCMMADWSVLTNGTFGAGPVTVTDADATNSPVRFYRISSP